MAQPWPLRALSPPAQLRGSARVMVSTGPGTCLGSALNLAACTAPAPGGVLRSVHIPPTSTPNLLLPLSPVPLGSSPSTGLSPQLPPKPPRRGRHNLWGGTGTTGGTSCSDGVHILFGCCTGQVYSQGSHPCWGHQGLALLDMGEAEATPAALSSLPKPGHTNPAGVQQPESTWTGVGTSQGQAGRAGRSAQLQRGGCE